MSDDSLGGRYKLIRCLRKTNFCETYLAEDIWLPEKPRCIVKKLQPSANEQFILETAKSSLTHEAQVLHRLSQHPQIPLLLAHLEVEGQFYLVQEFIEGKCLSHAEIVPGICWSEEKVISFLQEMLDILAFVHQQGVIHQDIKPSNLIRRIDNGKIALIDFSLAKEIANITFTKKEEPLRPLAVSIPSYMPREQQKGFPQFNSDIYALGITAIQALTGLPPEKLPQNDQTGDICWQNYASSCSTALAKIIDKMVRYEFIERYKSATEVIDDLEQLIRFRQQEHQSLRTKIIVIISSNYPRLREIKFWLVILSVVLGIIITILGFKIWHVFQALNSYELENTLSQTDNILIQHKESEKPLPEQQLVITAARDLDKKKMYEQLSKFLGAEQWKEADQQTWELIKQVAVKDGNYGGLSFSELESISCSDLKTIDNLWFKYSRGHFGLKVQKQIYESLAGNKLNTDRILFRSFALHVGWEQDVNYPNQEYKKYSELTFSLNAPSGHLPALSSFFWDYQWGVSDLSRAEDHERFYSLIRKLANCNI